ncbi:hypothetical protein ZOSMA_558G00080 [Zostera marina]|uniref:DUF679 domain membrane protein 2 n=1 Tax=Zostera marina TaxID=29655 RepID=A0A0K9NYD3_ZOSMR|nr:hypothetical protein ZOSMA_558G00080 [Zostera marina]
MEKPQSGTSVFLLPSKTTAQKLRQNTLKGVANLIKLLPTGTIFLFQFLNPVLTNNGYCPSVVSKTLTGILLSASGLMCCISSFTDSYTGGDGKIHYGIVTVDGLFTFWDPCPKPDDVAKFKLRFGDFVHAFFSLMVFRVIGLFDPNTVGCLYPSFVDDEKKLLKVLPPIIGTISGMLFMVFPNTRHGIGYPN